MRRAAHRALIFSDSAFLPAATVFISCGRAGDFPGRKASAAIEVRSGVLVARCAAGRFSSFAIRTVFRWTTEGADGFLFWLVVCFAGAMAAGVSASSIPKMDDRSSAARTLSGQFLEILFPIVPRTGNRNSSGDPQQGKEFLLT